MTDRDDLNNQAYIDVCELKNPTLPDNDVYMDCYRFWYNVAGGEKHFDPHYCESDYDDLILI